MSTAAVPQQLMIVPEIENTPVLVAHQILTNRSFTNDRSGRLFERSCCH